MVLQEAVGTAGQVVRQERVLPSSDRTGDRGFHTCRAAETELVRARVS